MKKAKVNLSMILFAAILALTGCGKDEQMHTSDRQQGTEQGTDQDADQGKEETVSWSVSHSPMLEQYEAATIADGKIYACRYGEGGLVISVFTADTVEQTASYEIPGVTELKNISVDASEQICLFGSTEEGEALWKVSPDGDISTIGDIEVENLGQWPSLKNFYVDSNGFYYLWYEMSVLCTEVYEDGEEGVYTALDRIYVKDQQMNTLVYEQVPDSYGNRLVSLVFDEDGIPLLLAKDEDGYYVQRIRTTDGEEYERSRLEADVNEFYNLETSRIIAYAQNGLLYVKNGSLHLYHTSDSQNEKLLDLAVAGIREEDIIYLGMRGGTIEIIDNHKGLEQSEYTAVEEGEDQRTQLTLGVMRLEQDMMEAIAAFNRYQNKVTIEPVAYVADYDFDTGYERLTLDIIQGKAPDLINLDGLNYNSLARAGAFTDLYTFMQQDAELNADDLVSSVLRVYETEGHLYTISPRFLIHTMWGAGSMTEGRKGIDVEEMIKLLRDNGGDINSIHGFYADESVLTTLCAFNMDKFIDWNEGTCDFTGEEFKQVLCFAKEYEGKPYDSLYLSIRNKDILLTLGLISSVEDYRLQSELYGENIQFIGYPTKTGVGSAVSFSGGEVAVNAKSGHQQEAWEFVKFFVQNGYGYEGRSFPLVREQFDSYLNESLNEEVVYEDGVMSSYSKMSYYERDIVSIHILKCEPGDVEAIRELVDNVSDKFQYNTEIQQIIDEEAGAYFHDIKDMEDVCSIIQNRVQLYLNERIN